MKRTFYLLLLIITTAFSVTAQEQKKEEVCYNPNLVKDTSKKSIKSMAYAVVDGDSIKINYHSPGVRKRIIWGGLVPYDEVWVTGAHDATTLEMPQAFVVSGKEIPAGKYAIFSIPGKTEWTLIINKNWKQHLATEYDEKEDVVRIKVKPKKVNHTERLQYFIETGKSKTGKIAVTWEKIRVEFDFKLIK
ncbi:MAG: DUF2911 domain-containing protein [Sediminibacterium sp. Gen4]|jgi:hypothetical protein|uniref:DUF2911 domain-containing protein n=1 Tax=unclassified Sediminibacterium TaxID=2635961 RepID=UPI0015BAD98B|nr:MULTISPECIES: DUF2911 domain-containing protein [unclassified Sediminibacterium]MBW0160237.1 DUF2911 domain-containing protein [Sediminibacterium sp.]MBW0164201.1 DUF2911 domain-containing protein [Sediminibacterium sp.]MDZ4071063.1 DUF2911 domain-containing protein [Sediminibacterium sp.]NWK65507.1 DUF2911 domain-containing protein [Sediminibacterium sp. Gen4]